MDELEFDQAATMQPNSASNNSGFVTPEWSVVQTRKMPLHSHRAKGQRVAQTSNSIVAPQGSTIKTNTSAQANTPKPTLVIAASGVGSTQEIANTNPRITPSASTELNTPDIKLDGNLRELQLSEFRKYTAGVATAGVAEGGNSKEDTKDSFTFYDLSPFTSNQVHEENEMDFNRNDNANINDMLNINGCFNDVDEFNLLETLPNSLLDEDEKQNLNDMDVILGNEQIPSQFTSTINDEFLNDFIIPDIDLIDVLPGTLPTPVNTSSIDDWCFDTQPGANGNEIPGGETATNLQGTHLFNIAPQPSTINMPQINIDQPFAINTSQINIDQPSTINASQINIVQPSTIDTSQINIVQPFTIDTSQINIDQPSTIDTSQINIDQPSTSNSVYQSSKIIFLPSNINIDQPSKHHSEKCITVQVPSHIGQPQTHPTQNTLAINTPHMIPGTAASILDKQIPVMSTRPKTSVQYKGKCRTSQTQNTPHMISGTTASLLDKHTPVMSTRPKTSVQYKGGSIALQVPSHIGQLQNSETQNTTHMISGTTASLLDKHTPVMSTRPKTSIQYQSTQKTGKVGLSRRRLTKKPKRLLEEYVLDDQVVEASNSKISSTSNTYLFEAPLQVPSTSSSVQSRKRKNEVNAMTDDEKYRRTRDLNNKASKKCRENKKLKMIQHDHELKDLKQKNEELNKRVERLIKEKEIMKQAIFRITDEKDHLQLKMMLSLLSP